MANPVTHFQIIAKDPDGVASFYGRLFGWKVDARNALGYRRISTGNGRGIDGGIWPAPPEAGTFVQLFVEVEDIDETLRRASELGGRVIVPKSTLPDGDTMAVMIDPSGLSVALVASSRAE